MGVDRMRSTKIAPEALSTSYLTGSASFGISMTTLISSGGLAPVGTRSRPMGVGCSGCCGGGGYSTRCGAANENGGPGGRRFRASRLPPLLQQRDQEQGHDVDDLDQRVDGRARSEEHTSELQSRENIVCRLLLEKKNSTRSMKP